MTASLIAVGRPHPNADTIPVQEGFRIILGRHSGVTVLGGFEGIRPNEVAATRTSLIDVALAEHGGALFFLMRIPGFVDGWYDMPFALGLVPDEEKGLPPRDDDEALLLTFVLLDFPSKIVASLRMATLSPQFCAVLEAEIEKQRAALGGFSMQRHMKAVQAAYARWPRADDMVKDALIVEQIGMPFEKGARRPGRA